MEVFRAAADIPPDLVHTHINVKENFSFHAVLRLLEDDQTEYFRGSTATIDFDHTIKFHTVRKGQAKDVRVHRFVGHLFWSKIEADITPKFRWAPSKDDENADALTRLESTVHVRHYHVVFGRFWLE